MKAGGGGGGGGKKMDGCDVKINICINLDKQNESIFWYVLSGDRRKYGMVIAEQCKGRSNQTYVPYQAFASTAN